MEKIRISLEAARVNAGLTQSMVARNMQVSRNTIINWEKGKIIPKIAQLEMLSRMYNMPLECILLPIESTIS